MGSESSQEHTSISGKDSKISTANKHASLVAKFLVKKVGGIKYSPKVSSGKR
jgi:hypothetical protein